ncbi:MAG: arginine repressor [Acidobacteria bacterium]|nr:arginine repressor [Acidobacteriota bacterium]
MTKKARQGRILEIVRKHSVRSQEELSSLLRAENIPVTQSTLSRDIRELGLIKIRGRYQSPGDALPAAANEHLRRALEQYVLSTGVSGNIVVIKTSPGNAHSVGVVLDAAQWSEVMGTIAGDDTIFVLAQNGRIGKRVLERVREFSSRR